VKSKVFIVFAAAVSLLAAPRPMAAHHGTAGYDMTKTVTLTGTVKEFDWSNPHCVIYVDVKSDNGEVKHWILELAPPILMSRGGWTKNALKPGDQITVETHPSKNGAPIGTSGTAGFILKVVGNGTALPTR
jgi:Family of unknown function (DUF6152)